MSRRLRTPAFLIGFALGGFLDGILLHQILQWHHVVSGVTDKSDLRFQAWADGVFHAIHYLLGVAGIALLYARRRDAATEDGGRVLAGATLLGFGAWHLLDAVVNHWALGLHRINETVANPLPWDLAFFGLGLASAVAGWMVMRGRGGGGGRVVAAGLVAVAIVAGPVSALPPAGVDPEVAALLSGMPLPANCVGWTVMAGR